MTQDPDLPSIMVKILTTMEISTSTCSALANATHQHQFVEMELWNLEKTAMEVIAVGTKCANSDLMDSLAEFLLVIVMNKKFALEPQILALLICIHLQQRIATETLEFVMPEFPTNAQEIHQSAIQFLTWQLDKTRFHSRTSTLFHLVASLLTLVMLKDDLL